MSAGNAARHKGDAMQGRSLEEKPAFAALARNEHLYKDVKFSAPAPITMDNDFMFQNIVGVGYRLLRRLTSRLLP